MNRGIISGLKTADLGTVSEFAMNAESRGKSILDKEFEEQVSMATAAQKNMSYDAIKNIATGKTVASESERTAAIRVGLKSGAYKDRVEIYKSIAKSDSEKIKTATTEGFFAQKDHQFFGAGMAGDIAKGGITENILSQNMVKSAGKYSTATIFEDAEATKDMAKAFTMDPKLITEALTVYQKNDRGIDVTDSNGNKIVDVDATNKKAAEYKETVQKIANMAASADTIPSIQGSINTDKADAAKLLANLADKKSTTKSQTQANQ
jgi:hypothetical protein